MHSKNEIKDQDKDNHTKKLQNDVRNSEATIFLFNIGSCCSGEITHQELPPFLNKMNNVSYEVFNIDPAYKKYSGDNRYAVQADKLLFALVQGALDSGKKIILFDNTCQSGLEGTHYFARNNLSNIGDNLEIIIGYGVVNGDPVIPILHPSKNFFEKSKEDSSTQIRNLASMYCDGGQTLTRVKSANYRAKLYKLIPENETITKENWGDYFISHQKAKDLIKTRANEKEIEIYFELEDFENIPLFKGSKKELNNNDSLQTPLTIFKPIGMGDEAFLLYKDLLNDRPRDQKTYENYLSTTSYDERHRNINNDSIASLIRYKHPYLFTKLNTLDKFAQPSQKLKSQPHLFFNVPNIDKPSDMAFEAFWLYKEMLDDMPREQKIYENFLSETKYYERYRMINNDSIASLINKNHPYLLNKLNALDQSALLEKESEFKSSDLSQEPNKS